MSAFDKLKFAMVNMIGYRVQVQTTCGTVYEGIFQAASSHPGRPIGVVLGHAYKKTNVDPKTPFSGPPVPANRDTVTKQLVIKEELVAQIAVVGVDLSYTAPPPDGIDGFTDTGISGGYGRVRERKLEAWAPAPEDEAFDVGDLGSGGTQKGWRAEDMFEKNARDHQYKSEYNELDYTTEINRNHPDYIKRMNLAEKAARDIIHSGSGGNVNPHILAERGFDIDKSEEDQFSSVLSDKYVPPSRRHGDTRGSPSKSGAPPGLGKPSIQNGPGQKSSWGPQSKGPPGIPNPKSSKQQKSANAKNSQTKADREREAKSLKEFSSEFKLDLAGSDNKSGNKGATPEGKKTYEAPNAAPETNGKEKSEQTKKSESKLNPAAKEFSFNPNAKTFDPSKFSSPAPAPASAPVPARVSPHTTQGMVQGSPMIVQTPGPGAYITNPNMHMGVQPQFIRYPTGVDGQPVQGFMPMQVVPQMVPQGYRVQPQMMRQMIPPQQQHVIIQQQQQQLQQQHAMASMQQRQQQPQLQPQLQPQQQPQQQ